jgi:uncharacterized cupredoxin-like copper-binding protein
MKNKVRLVFIVAAIGLLVASCSPAGPQKVEVRLSEFAIQSSLTNFEAGKTYEFVITNAGALKHEFTIMPPGSGMVMEGHDMGDTGHNMEGAILHIGEDQLTPGATITVQFTFEENATTGNLEFACHLPEHYEGGMFTTITIGS